VLLPKSFFAGSETFVDTSKACSKRFQNSPFRLNYSDSLFFRFEKIYGKNVSMSAQKYFPLGNSLQKRRPKGKQKRNKSAL
jgi:hypothetical protein